MTRRPSLRLPLTLMALTLVAACDVTLHTGKVGNTRNPPSPEGACATGLALCGRGAFAQCLDLQNNPAHCGACDDACMPGIACQSGVCQQVACTGQVTVTAQAVPAGLSASPSSAVLADINGDGRPDLVSWGMYDGEALATAFQVALGQASGGFASPTTYRTASHPRSITAKDPDDDGVADLYVVGSLPRASGGDSCWLEVWLGHADGKLTLDRRSEEIAGCVDTTIVDLNGDGMPDLVAEIANASVPTFLLADANGDLHASAPGCPGQRVWDWNGDGYPDLVRLLPTLGVCLNRGNGTFDDLIDCGILTESFNPAGSRASRAVIADFNHDGLPDLATGIDNGVDILLGMGGCQFEPMTEYPLSALVQLLTGGDVNGDGLPDLVASTKDGTVFLLLNGPAGQFHSVPFSMGSPSGGQAASSLVVGDVTGDGRTDIVVVYGHSPGRGLVEDGKITSVPGASGSTTVMVNTCP